MNTKTESLRRNYDKLEPLERFQLMLSAYERGDDEEVSALTRTAPQKTYQMMAWPYTGMLEGIHKVGWACVTDVLRCGLFLFSAWFIETAHGIPTAEETREPEGDEFNWWATGLEFANEAMAAWEGLEVFADDLGITAAQALRHAPCIDAAKLVIKQATTFLAMDGDFRRWLAYDHLRLDEEKAEAMLAAGGKVIRERRETSARKAADLYVKIWEKEIA